MSHRVLVYGLGVSGLATAARLLSEGTQVVAVDDDAGERPRRGAAELGIDLVGAPDGPALEALARTVDEIVVSPGVPACHLVFSLEATVPVIGEVELAWRRSTCPIVAVTGTNGKTTVTTLVESMLEASGRRAVAAGNIGLPLLEAVSGDAEVVVAEVSSFQLALTSTFRPAVGAWLNFSADHLDWHPTVDDYRDAKAKLWANSGPGDVAVVNSEDPVVLGASEVPRRRGATLGTFGISAGDWTVRAGVLVGPDGSAVARIDELVRTMPHDVVDALCALATASAAGASPEGCRRALLAFRGLPHRVELVGEASGVRFYDDSKATTPGAVLAAVEGCAPAVLIAGGRNKGLDLSVLGAAASRLRGVVAIGEATEEVVSAFAGSVPVTRALSMARAVEAATAMARAGDSVVLSPACASFDWYRSYAERGDDFARCVRAVAGFTAPVAGVTR
ncbi:MAG TPA: UDP-N-acetylmuramoyl-L-alanine--D-glutamate ligase [Acidimicrobiales bacterium]|nr:UDP-N-acetylmuramoyl-L-alanine--D-glutamate ligase [Acidimicrobiales bacterium]